MNSISPLSIAMRPREGVEHRHLSEDEFQSPVGNVALDDSHRSFARLLSHLRGFARLIWYFNYRVSDGEVKARRNRGGERQSV